MTDRDNEYLAELPARFAMTLVDTSSLLGSGMLTTPTTTPTTGSSGTSGTSGTDLLSGALTKVGSAQQLAQQSNAGATAQNLNSVGSTSTATVP